MKSTKTTKTPKPRTTKVTWIETKKQLPERYDHAFYGKRYSVPVVLADSTTMLFRWDYRHQGWVAADWCEGPDPEHYEVYEIVGDRWHPVPTPPKRKPRAA